jgi:CTP:molybdopterin cytidylyltransferase MocA
MTAAVVLCAGGATRFSGSEHKLLSSFRGRPLVWWAVVHALGAELAETVVVVGAVDLEAVLPPGVLVVENANWQSGQASSLRFGLESAGRRGHQAVVIGLGDQPLIPSSTWCAVARATTPIAIASFGGRRTPPVLLDRSVWPLMPTTGDRGARDLIASRPELVSEVPGDGDPFDIDTYEDLLRCS